MWSGAVDEFTVSNTAYDYLIPAFVEYLMTVPPRFPYPPDPEVRQFTAHNNSATPTIQTPITSSFSLVNADVRWWVNRCP